MGKMLKVCIDSGHYGKYNQSNLVPSYYESIFAWKMAGYLKKYLEAFGCEVILTRDNLNKDLDLYTRGATSKGCDLFLSLHSNASTSSKTDYVVTFYGHNEPQTKGLALELSHAIAKTMGTLQYPQALTKVSNKTGGEYYGVLRGAKAVGTKYRFIVEHSFHTNKNMAMFLLQEANIQKLAYEEATVIANHFKLNNLNTSINDTRRKIARVIVEELNVRKVADWSAKACQVVNYGDCFTIVDTVEAKNGSTKMHKLKSGLYITASPRYVETTYIN